MTRNSRSFRKRGQTWNPRDISASALQLPAIRMFRTGDTAVITIKSQWMNSFATVGRVQNGSRAISIGFVATVRIVIETLGSFQHCWEGNFRENFRELTMRNDLFDENNGYEEESRDRILIYCRVLYNKKYNCSGFV